MPTTMLAGGVRVRALRLQVRLTNAAEIRETAGSLDRVRDVTAATFATRSGNGIKQVRMWMAAETWMNAEEARSHGFVDEIETEKPTCSPRALVASMMRRLERQQVGT